ncbi:hypothetical protein AKJ16_DCAP12145 [Drosera capensis]
MGSSHNDLACSVHNSKSTWASLSSAGSNISLHLFLYILHTKNHWRKTSIMKENRGGCSVCLLLLLILLSPICFTAVDAVPTSRSFNFAVQAPSIRDLCAQGMMDIRVCEKKIRDAEDRLLIDITDYPDPGYNPGHDPPPVPAPPTV